MMASFTIINTNQGDNFSEDSSDDEVNIENFVMYKDREEWSDLKPVVQNDGAHKVVSIRYTPQFEDTYNYFRGVLAADEKSDRALKLTEDCIRFNASNYTVWHYRRILIEKLNKDLIEEIKYTNGIIKKSPKNYQVWEHQKFLLKKIKEKIENHQMAELSLDDVTRIFKDFINDVLIKYNDDKNYHAWQQRQWFIHYWDRFDDELEFTDMMIQYDIRNNSAWNHRFYVHEHLNNFNNDNSIQKEFDYVMQLIKRAVFNESTWNYLLGLVKKTTKNVDSLHFLKEFARNLYENPDCEQNPRRKDLKNPPIRSPHLLFFLFKFSCMQLDEMIKQKVGGKELENIRSEAKGYCEELAEFSDTIRRVYWEYQASQLLVNYPSQ